MAMDNVIEKINMEGVPEQLVFGLDIGTRNVVGTVGYKESTNKFVVVAQTMMEHETRAMMDGQIHDIGMVAQAISRIHKKLEQMTDRRLKDVCIAAAGRVLKTVEASALIEFSSETVVDSENIYTLEMMGVENAYEILRKEKQSDDIRFYCVGYSVKHYYQNDYAITNLEGHKCNSIKCELIATFLPDEVVDGLYAAVEKAGLYVANLTLEPIAAINVAIPENFRLLNIALVDVGAGTSDISITKDGSIVAYGMIPFAGDEVTECLARYYLTDFNEADSIKCQSTTKDKVEFKDIMGISHEVTPEEITEVVSETVTNITKNVAEKIKELNGGKPVSAVFVVGGGGKITGFTDSLAQYLGIQKERVALRGSEVMGNIKFMQQDIEVDSLLVTPVGICLNFYEQRNNFIFVTVNGERIKLYDNSRLTITDAAMQLGFPNDDLFPKRGKSLVYYVNGEKRMARGERGESAKITLNGNIASISNEIVQNDKIEIIPSTAGAAASVSVGSIPELKSGMKFIFNGKELRCPRFVLADGQFVSEYYEIKDEEHIEILDFYTLKQILEFMDIIHVGKVYVNNIAADMDTKVYDNFEIVCEISRDEPNFQEITDIYGNGLDRIKEIESLEHAPELSELNQSYDDVPVVYEKREDKKIEIANARVPGYTGPEFEIGYNRSIDEKNGIIGGYGALAGFAESASIPAGNTVPDEGRAVEQPSGDDFGYVQAVNNSQPTASKNIQPVSINIIVNGDAVTLSGKAEYILVDVLDFYPVDTSVAHGDKLLTSVNGMDCDFMHPVKAGDVCIIKWVGKPSGGM